MRQAGPPASAIRAATVLACQRASWLPLVPIRSSHGASGISGPTRLSTTEDTRDTEVETRLKAGSFLGVLSVLRGGTFHDHHREPWFLCRGKGAIRPSTGS